MNILIILFSAGIGKRLRLEIPKPLCPIMKTNPLDYNLSQLIRFMNSIPCYNTMIYINLHKQPNIVYDHLFKKYQKFIEEQKIIFIYESQPLGHIGTINLLKYNIISSNKLVLINSDTLIPNLETILEKLIQKEHNFMLLYQILQTHNSKTLTHFEVMPYLNYYKIIKYHKVTPNSTRINLYTGTMIVNISYNISKYLSKDLSSLSFLDFVSYLIENDLLAFFVPRFYEITSTRDLLEINVSFIKDHLFFDILFPTLKPLNLL
ncbi:MAG: hypothetical protein ABDH21_04485 [bacterium]